MSVRKAVRGIGNGGAREIFAVAPHPPPTVRGRRGLAELTRVEGGQTLGQMGMTSFMSQPRGANDGNIACEIASVRLGVQVGGDA